MTSRIQHIKIHIKASYYQIGNEKNPERIWLVCHGYGQLASRFIKKFENLDLEKNLIIAPEGLSHFYLDGLSGNVGASWMTKHDRETEIENQFSFLENLMMAKTASNRSSRISLFGFSQGGATICRWAAGSAIRFDDLFLWATIFPPDMDRDFLNKSVSNKKVKLFYGDEDPFIKDEHITMAQDLLKIIPHLETIRYKGDHRVIPQILLENIN